MARKAELERMDAEAARKLSEQLELSEAQTKRMAEVQESAQYYSEED